jgi:hypothetical protein
MPAAPKSAKSGKTGLSGDFGLFRGKGHNIQLKKQLFR